MRKSFTLLAPPLLAMFSSDYVLTGPAKVRLNIDNFTVQLA